MTKKCECYQTIDTPVESTIRVKGSRFLGYAFPVEGLVEFKDILAQRSKQYHDATHHCWGYRIIVKDRIEEMSSDAGEPSGTAGKPILSAVSGMDLCNVGVIITRYFGGTKLGTGGLARAYGDCANTTLDQAEVIVKVVRDTMVCRFPYESLHVVMRIIDRYQGTVVESDYALETTLTILIPLSKMSPIKAELTDACRGSIEFIN